MTGNIRHALGLLVVAAIMWFAYLLFRDVEGLSETAILGAIALTGVGLYRLAAELLSGGDS